MNRLFTLAFLSLILAINCTYAVNIDCNHQQNVWVPFGILSECLAYNVISKEPGQVLDSVQTYNSLSDFKSFYIYKSPLCYFLPSGITEKFENLEVLVLAHTGLRSITKDDLKPFSKLRGLYIDYSKITSIHGDLFINNKNLEELSLQQNGIKYVESDSFKSLRKLTSFSFERNDCYDGKANGRDNVNDLIINIEQNCHIKEFVRNEVETSTQVQQTPKIEEDIDDSEYSDYSIDFNFEDERIAVSERIEEIKKLHSMKFG
jgi:hypothetical protein